MNFTPLQAGRAGINFHGGGKRHYSAIQDDTDDKKPVPTFVRAMPTYCALLVFQEMIANDAQLLPVSVESAGNVKLWAVRDAKGQMRVLAINKELTKSIDLTLQSGRKGNATLKRLAAPAIAVSEGLRYAGQTFDESKDGKPVGELKVETPAMRDGAIHFHITPTSAVVVEVK